MQSHPLVNYSRAAMFLNGFSLTHALMFFAVAIISPLSLWESHYAYDWPFYLFFVVLPLAIGTLFACLFAAKVREILPIALSSILLLPLVWLFFTILIHASDIDGYIFKRPKVFNEVFETKSVEAISFFKMIDSMDQRKVVITDSPVVWSEDYFVQDKYAAQYHTRLFVALRHHTRVIDSEVDFKRNLFDKNFRLAQSAFDSIIGLMLEDKILPSFYKSYIGRELFVTGQIAQLKMKDGSRFYYLGLYGGELTNDKSVYFEFLYELVNGKIQLVKHQMLYDELAWEDGLSIVFVFRYFNLLALGLVYGILILTITLRKGIQLLAKTAGK